MRSKIIFILIALELLATTDGAKKRFTVEVHQLTCTNVSAPVKYLKCEFKKQDIGRYAINVKFLLERVLNKNTLLHGMIHVQKGGRVLKFLDVKFNICDLLTKALSIPLAKQLLNEAMRSSNIPRACPMKGNVPYNVNNFSVTDEFFPIYTPTLDFNFTMHFYENQKMLGSFLLQGAVIAKN